jgi:hypothetical protein
MADQVEMQASLVKELYPRNRRRPRSTTSPIGMQVDENMRKYAPLVSTVRFISS